MPSKTVLYVYAITRKAAKPRGEAIDRSEDFVTIESAGVCAVATPVSASEFSQEAIDGHAGDLEWLGAIGYRHQAVVADLMKQTAIVPLRAFSLFSSEDALRTYLAENAEAFRRVLDRLDGKQEWTLRIEFEPERWSESLTKRVDALRSLHTEINRAAPGKAFLLKKKLDEAKKSASKEAEQQIVIEIESAILEALRCETIAESRQERSGGFPQINVLINRDEESRLQDVQEKVNDRYATEGVTVALTGPWPPYSFAAMNNG
ncbi:MAG: GvpL/GvpF family gas vesicle protein [Thermoanaerobaculia bacterium]